MSFDTYICVIISAHVLSLFNLCVFGKVTLYYMFFLQFITYPYFALFSCIMFTLSLFLCAVNCTVPLGLPYVSDI
jgi:hypothetical protein